MKRTLFAAIAALMLLPATSMARDSNHDRIPDRWEKSNHLSLHKNQARRDQDSDGVRNLSEYRHGLDPRSDDSDGDGVEDGSEAGSVTSFDATSGKLVIGLLDGSSLSGLVTSDTELECEASDDVVATASDHGGSDDQSGDDDGNEQGDDHGSDDEGGDDQGEEHHHHGSSCDPSALTAGAKVHEADLNVSSAGAIWNKVELA